MQQKRMKPFIMTTMNGMVYGLFATLIIGVIFQQFGKLLNIDLIEFTLSNTLKGLMGVGIGMGIALALKMDGLKLVVSASWVGLRLHLKSRLQMGLF